MALSVPGSMVPRPKIAAVERRKACALAHKHALPRVKNAAEVFKTAPFGALLPFGGFAGWGHSKNDRRGALHVTRTTDCARRAGHDGREAPESMQDLRYQIDLA